MDCLLKTMVRVSHKVSGMLLAVTFVLFSGCQRYGVNEEKTSKASSSTLFIAPIAGDSKGQIAAALIASLDSSSICWQFAPSQDSAQYTIHLNVVDTQTSTIGYRYDREDLTKAKIDRLIQDESRSTLVLEGSLHRRGEKKPVLEPFRIEGSCAYDYINSHALVDAAFINDEGQLESVLEFSLGQLDALDGAIEASGEALLKDLAQNFSSGMDRIYYDLK